MKKNTDVLQGKRKDSGFTLIEAMIALLILTVSILGIFKIHIQSVKTAGFNKRTLAGIQFARSALEIQRSAPYTSLTTGTTQDKSKTAADFAQSSNQTTDLKFLREVTISNVGGIAKTKRVKVQVGWDELGDCSDGTMANCDHNIILETYLTDAY